MASPEELSVKWTVAVSHGAGVTPCCITLKPIEIGVPSIGGLPVWASATMSAQPPARTGAASASNRPTAVRTEAIRRNMAGLLPLDVAHRGALVSLVHRSRGLGSRLSGRARGALRGLEV